MFFSVVFGRTSGEKNKNSVFSVNHPTRSGTLAPIYLSRIFPMHLIYNSIGGQKSFWQCLKASAAEKNSPPENSRKKLKIFVISEVRWYFHWFLSTHSIWVVWRRYLINKTKKWVLTFFGEVLLDFIRRTSCAQNCKKVRNYSSSAICINFVATQCLVWFVSVHIQVTEDALVNLGVL